MFYRKLVKRLVENEEEDVYPKGYLEVVDAVANGKLDMPNKSLNTLIKCIQQQGTTKKALTLYRGLHPVEYAYLEKHKKLKSTKIISFTSSLTSARNFAGNYSNVAYQQDAPLKDSGVIKITLPIGSSNVLDCEQFIEDNKELLHSGNIGKYGPKLRTLVNKLHSISYSKKENEFILVGYKFEVAGTQIDDDGKGTIFSKVKVITMDVVT